MVFYKKLIKILKFLYECRLIYMGECPECSLGELNLVEEPGEGQEYEDGDEVKWESYWCCDNVDCGKCFDLKFNKL